MKAIYVFAAAVAALASVDAKAAGIQEVHPIDWYDCAGKRDGNYLHPTDCTRFISCSGGVASERDCADCNVPGRCRDGRTVYNDTVDACLWADETECKVAGDGGSGSTQAPTTTTQGPTDGPTDGTRGPTEAPENPSTTPGQDDPETPREGGRCDVNKCWNTGECQEYLRCEGGIWVADKCGDNLVWNPYFLNGTEHIHGGNCDTWDNLKISNEALYDQLMHNKTCMGCFWEQIDECSRDYKYQPPNGTNRNVLTLSCGEGLVFVEDKTTCERCQDVKKANGDPCC